MYKLLASAPSLESITKLVNEYFYSMSSAYYVTQVGKQFILVNSVKPELNESLNREFRVIKKARRYRFEMVIPD